MNPPLQLDPTVASASTEELDGQLFAAIDLGSNSFHLVVARFEHGQLQVIDRIKEMVRLAEGVDGKGRLDPAVEQRAFDCLTIFGQRIAQISQTRVSAVGTNALRRMKEGWRFLNEAETRLGVPIEIISGHEEARLVYLGVAQGIAEQGNQRLVIDIGGGSTEFAIGREFTPLLLHSMYFGCVGVAQKYFGKGKITRKRWKKAATAVAVELQRFAGEFKALGWQEAIGSSGTMKAVRNVLLSQGWSERGIHPEGLEQLREELLRIGHVEGLTFEGLSERRRPVFASGAVIVATCMEVLGIEHMIVADAALREGLLHDLVGRMQDVDPRDGSVQALMERYHVDRQQAERVESLGLALFDQVAGDWQLGEQARDWLQWAARVHEIGLIISHHGYHRHGAYLIQNADLPGFSRQEQTILATLIAQHRRKPDLDYLTPLLERIRPTVLRVSSLLRLAVLFNRTRPTQPAPAIGARADRDRLSLRFPEGWLEEHPLTGADLVQEVDRLKRLGIALVLD